MDQSGPSDSDPDKLTPPSDGTKTTSPQHCFSTLLCSLLCHFFLTFLGEAKLFVGNFIVSSSLNPIPQSL
uniref:Uncharacterized protein MANES_13G100300 n=1 Tax=Rhizophora mucronata TaxID=61149 RepID=A0A2P2JC24_RHIMU